ncbi:hypothetical protein [Methylotenera sp.]|uniref:hypothetical protein n=1 Tax=Methylotenera sp. TaxID=2051956 RepID=UPI0025E29860|nr:hypothetical protein [Methylotenera sp.]
MSIGSSIRIAKLNMGQNAVNVDQTTSGNMGMKVGIIQNVYISAINATLDFIELNVG